MYTYFMSDIHMGTNQKEDWYQDYVHEGSLQSVLSYIMGKGKETDDVVILGDWFDNWIYSRDVKIPASHDMAARCIEKNKNLFQRGNKGNFIDLMDAVSGDLYYVNGNHDMDISVDDINSALKPQLGSKKVMGNPEPTKNTIYESKDHVIYAEHGHAYSLLCDKDMTEKNDVKPLPLGYFISRTVADITKHEVEEKKVRSAAELKEDGIPSYGMELVKFLVKQIFMGHDVDDLPRAALAYLLNLDSYSQLKNVFYHLQEDKGEISADAAAGYYPWIKTGELLNFNSKESVKFMEADANNSLDSFGREICDQGEHKVVIMGHTHVPHMMTGTKGTGIYVNTGFMCPDLPGLKDGSKAVSFVEVESQEKYCNVRIMMVDYKTGQVKPSHEYRINK